MNQVYTSEPESNNWKEYRKLVENWIERTEALHHKLDSRLQGAEQKIAVLLAKMGTLEAQLIRASERKDRANVALAVAIIGVTGTILVALITSLG